MQYYFFRDLDHESNLEDGRTFHASGLVDKLFSEIGNPSNIGKDVVVRFLHPFESLVQDEWRSFKEIEIFEVREDQYEYAKGVLADIKNRRQSITQ